MITFEKAERLLTKDFDETAQVLTQISETPVDVRRSESMAFIELKEIGISLAATQDSWRRRYGLNEKNPADGFFVTGIHFHSVTSKGYRPFIGSLWNCVSFGQKLGDVTSTHGSPVMSGGGAPSKIVSGVVPRWIKYALGENKFAHLQFNVCDELELVTVMLERP